jgi:hypothetical protein
VVHLKWQASLTDSERRSVEARFYLADGGRLEEDTWRYDLLDPSRDNIRALVVEPTVSDTQNIDRSNGALVAFLDEPSVSLAQYRRHGALRRL